MGYTETKRMGEFMENDPCSQQAASGAEAIAHAFRDYHSRFQEITRLAKTRFEQGDWHAMQADAIQRLDLYNEIIGGIVSAIKRLLDGTIYEKATWGADEARLFRNDRRVGRYGACRNVF
jgi:isocitrate dehydrogenase kinase/phosphatase